MSNAKPSAEDVVAEEAVQHASVDRVLHARARQRILAADVDESRARSPSRTPAIVIASTIANGIAVEQHAILERAGSDSSALQMR